MAIGWLQFAGMIAIQLVAVAAWFAKTAAKDAAQVERFNGMLATFETIAETHAKEIQRLRDWRHDFGQKEGVYDQFHTRIEENCRSIERVEARMDRLEDRVGDIGRRTGYKPCE